jgi:hypothetical protein
MSLFLVETRRSLLYLLKAKGGEYKKVHTERKIQLSSMDALAIGANLFNGIVNIPTAASL